MPIKRKPAAGFTLAELLIALVILGLIATFTIPKVLQSQQSNQWKAVSKETAAAISQAYQIRVQEGSLSSSDTGWDYTSYFNYIKEWPTNGHTNDCTTCAGIQKCMQLASGVGLNADNNASFGDTASTSALVFSVDPDDEPSSSGCLQFFLYYDGRIVSQEFVLPGTQNSTTGFFPSSPDPTWFGWN